MDLSYRQSLFRSLLFGLDAMEVICLSGADLLAASSELKRARKACFSPQPFAAMISCIAPNLRDPLGPWTGRQLASGEI